MTLTGANRRVEWFDRRGLVLFPLREPVAPSLKRKYRKKIPSIAEDSRLGSVISDGVLSRDNRGAADGTAGWGSMCLALLGVYTILGGLLESLCVFASVFACVALPRSLPLATIPSRAFQAICGGANGPTTIIIPSPTTVIPHCNTWH